MLIILFTAYIMHGTMLKTFSFPNSKMILLSGKTHELYKQQPTLITDSVKCVYMQLLYLKNVQVKDYKILCVAKVELVHKRLFVIGMLGEWFDFSF